MRNISFKGAARSNDETMRRELRQLEGALLSNVALERSKQRLQQQPFLETVDFDTTPVAGSAGPGRRGLQRQGAAERDHQRRHRLFGRRRNSCCNGSFQDSDFMGSGNSVALQIDAGPYNKIYSFSHTNPYATIEGVSRTVSLTYRSSTQFVSASSNFKSDNLALGVSYGYPISEFQRVSAGVSLRRAPTCVTYQGSSAQQAVDWVQGQRASLLRERCCTTRVLGDGTSVTNAT